MKKSVFLVGLWVSWSWARPYIPDLEDVPIPELLGRYQKLVQKAPKNAHHHYVLGRLSAMAYAKTVHRFQVTKSDKQVYFGPFDPGFPPNPPGHPVPTDEHLKVAVSEYARAVQLDPKFLAARLGYGWCLEQTGSKELAKAQYRKVVATSYPADRQSQGAHFTLSMTQEAGGYLLGLLDPRKDATEIEQVRAKIAELDKIPRAVTPMLLPLDPKTPWSELVNSRAKVGFDLDGSGRKQSWNWPTPKAGWLVYLKNRKTVTSGLQMMGSVSFWIFWSDGYQAMSSLDEDGDGWLKGRELDGLKLWRDINSDGLCKPSELIELNDFGIQALATRGDRPFAQGRWHPSGVVYRKGRAGPSYDWVPSLANSGNYR